MKLELRGNDERYIVEQSLLNLFPGEKPVYEPITPEDDTWAVVSVQEEPSQCHVKVELSFGGKSAPPRHRPVLFPGSPGRHRRHASLGHAHRRAARQARHLGIGGGEDPR